MEIAGHNGAGKTTCYETFLRHAMPPQVVRHINPDEIEKDIRADLAGSNLSDLEFSRMAQQEAERMRNIELEGGSNFSFETVGSHESKVTFLRRARDLGYVVALLFVGPDSPEKSRDRVALRVSRGGRGQAGRFRWRHFCASQRSNRH